MADEDYESLKQSITGLSSKSQSHLNCYKIAADVDLEEISGLENETNFFDNDDTQLENLSRIKNAKFNVQHKTNDRNIFESHENSEYLSTDLSNKCCSPSDSCCPQMPNYDAKTSWNLASTDSNLSTVFGTGAVNSKTSKSFRRIDSNNNNSVSSSSRIFTEKKVLCDVNDRSDIFKNTRISLDKNIKLASPICGSPRPRYLNSKDFTSLHEIISGNEGDFDDMLSYAGEDEILVISASGDDDFDINVEMVTKNCDNLRKSDNPSNTLTNDSANEINFEQIVDNLELKKTILDENIANLEETTVVSDESADIYDAASQTSEVSQNNVTKNASNAETGIFSKNVESVSKHDRNIGNGCENTGNFVNKFYSPKKFKGKKGRRKLPKTPRKGPQKPMSLAEEIFQADGRWYFKTLNMVDKLVQTEEFFTKSTENSTEYSENAIEFPEKGEKFTKNPTEIEKFQKMYSEESLNNFLFTDDDSGVTSLMASLSPMSENCHQSGNYDEESGNYDDDNCHESPESMPGMITSVIGSLTPLKKKDPCVTNPLLTVPASEIELLDATHRGLYKFIPRHIDELEIEIGDPIYVQTEFEDLWCQGVNLRSGFQGIFPVAHVSDLEYSEFDPDALKYKKERFLLDYLGSVETHKPKGHQALRQAVKKIVKSRANKSSVQTNALVLKCVLEVSDRGVHMINKSDIHNSAKSPYDFFFHLKHVSFCGFVPEKPVFFGFITKHPVAQKFACHVFRSTDTTRPVAEAFGRAFDRFYKKYIEAAYPTEDLYIDEHI